jgi:hypothetical protein
MPDPTWPPGSSGNPFPQRAFIGARQSFGPGVVFFQTSSGPGKMRRKGTRQQEFHSTPMEMTGAQLNVFNTWFTTTLLQGSLPFTWVNMFTGLPARYRFKEGKRPEFELAAPAPNYTTAPNVSGGERQKIYTAMFELELLP